MRPSGGALRLPLLASKTVLDVGAWDGWFSFRAEAEGATRVVALDSFVWALDFTRADEYWEYVHGCEARGEPYDPWGPECAFWDVEALVGKRGFDLARTALGSRAQALITDFEHDDLSELGTFDVVLFLGVLYHLRAPFVGLERLRSLTGELAVIETAAIKMEDLKGAALVEFVPGCEVNRDPTTWWLPTEEALLGMCRAAGFATVEVVAADFVQPPRGPVVNYRLTVHARP